jgi:predicted DNA-binding transcriptional regulator YafY
MSHWQKKEVDFAEMHQALQQNRGLSIRELARHFSVAPSTILRRLPGMDEAGYPLYEDEQGKLYPFDDKQ